MKIERRSPLIDGILAEWRGEVSDAFAGYRNHVYRMVNFAFALGDFDEADRQKIAIAGAFHDIGIWPDNNFDYLPTSIQRANEYLRSHGLTEWSTDIGAMIGEHHKLREFPGDPLVEAFRKGDLADFSLGLLKQGLPASYVREVKVAFPNAGFHKELVKAATRWICRHPLNPVPVVKW